MGLVGVEDCACVCVCVCTLACAQTAALDEKVWVALRCRLKMAYSVICHCRFARVRTVVAQIATRKSHHARKKKTYALCTIL